MQLLAAIKQHVSSTDDAIGKSARQRITFVGMMCELAFIDKPIEANLTSREQQLSVKWDVSGQDVGFQSVQEQNVFGSSTRTTRAGHQNKRWKRQHPL